MKTVKFEALCKMGLVDNPSDCWHEELEVSSVGTAIEDVQKIITAYNNSTDANRFLISCTEVKKTTIDIITL